MHKKSPIKNRWIDRWICSDNEELLEQEGATTCGIALLDELNEVYRRTGVLDTIRRAVCLEIERIHAVVGRPVKILEIGMRDGALLCQVACIASEKGTPLELHGVEFKQNFVDLAQERTVGSAHRIHGHCADSRDLQEFESNSFDIVYSTFVLHHQSMETLPRLLAACCRVSRGACFHFDLSRSLWGIVALWSMYSVLGCWQSRSDAVLSCRRAYRKDEIEHVVQGLSDSVHVTVRWVPPIFWCIHTYCSEA